MQSAINRELVNDRPERDRKIFDLPLVSEEPSIRQTKVLTRLARSRVIFSGDFEAASRELTEAASETLDVERVSIWMFNAERNAIKCVDLFQRGLCSHSHGTEIRASEFPGYFKALQQARVIAAHDAHHDPATMEFSASYLTPLGISSMLDAPLWIGGRIVGVICHEHLGVKRHWSSDEQHFAGSMADFVCLAIEAHERAKAEELLRHAQKLESLGVLAGGIAHDFNNLLSGIMGNIGLVMEDPSLSTRARTYASRVETAAARAAELTNQLLAYAGKSKFTIAPVDVSVLVKDMTELLHSSISKKAELKCELAEPLPAIEADETQIRQIVMNLITNASDAIGDKQGVIDVNTGVENLSLGDLEDLEPSSQLAPGKYVFLRVADSGCGMDQETISKIYDPFFTTKFTGRGLGLAAVSGITRAHRGGIKVISSPGHGTVFTVFFPASQDTLVRQEVLPPRERRAEVSFSGHGTVLVIDDDTIVRTLVESILESRGFTVLCAANGLDGVALFRDNASQIRAVLLDMTMPDLNGEEVLVKLREIKNDMPVILSSGYSGADLAPRLKTFGRCNFLQKPYMPSALLKCLQDLL